MTVAALVGGGVLAGLLALLAMRRPRLALGTLVVVTMTNAGAVLSSSIGLPVALLALALGLGAWTIGMALGRKPLRSSPEVLLLAVLIALLVPSVIATEGGEEAWSSIQDLLRHLVLLAVLVGLVRTWGDSLMVARWATLSLAAVAALTVVNGFVLGGSTDLLGFAVVSDSQGVGSTIARHQGPFDDPNFYGRVLVLGLPFALSLGLHAWHHRSWLRLLIWSGSFFSLAGGIYLTQSRGTMLAAAIAVVAWMVVAGPRPRRAIVFLPAALGLAFLLPGVGSRLASLADLNAPAFAEVDYSLVERSAAQEVRWAMFLDNPGLGVGPGNTSRVWTEYMTAADSGITREVAAHNLYLEALAESGLLGFLGWGVFLAGVVVLGFRAVRSQPVERLVPPSLERLLAAAVIAAVVGWSTASVFLHLAFLGPLLVVVTVLAGLELKIPRALPPADPTRARAAVRRGAGTGLVILAPLGLLLSAHLLLREQVWVAEIPVALVTSTRADQAGADAYAQDVTSDNGTIATYAAVVERVGDPLVRDRDGVTMSVGGAASEAVVVVRVEAADRAVALEVANAVAEAGDAFVDQSTSLSALATTRVGRAYLTQESRGPLTPG